MSTEPDPSDEGDRPLVSTPEAGPTWPQDDPSLQWLSRERRSVAGYVAASFWLLPGSLYGLTVCKGTGWLDASMIANHVHLMKSNGWVNSHNLFLYTARLWVELVPIQDMAYSLNLLAALLGTVTVFMVFQTTLELTRNLAASTLGAVALMLSHSLWWHSTMVEVYTLNTALMTGMIYLIVRYGRTRSLYHLYGALLCWGLGIANHVLMGLFLFPFLALFAIPRLWSQLWNPKVIGGGMLVVALGGQLWVTKVFDDYTAFLNRDAPTLQDRSPEVRWEQFSETTKRAFGGRFQDRMFTESMPTSKKWKWRANFAMLLGLNYPSVAFVMGWLGLYVWGRRKEERVSFVFLTVGLAAQTMWSANYFIWDMYAFGLPVWVLFSLPIGVGFDRVLRLKGRVRTVVLALLPTLLIGPWLHVSVSGWAKEPGFWNEYFRGLQGRNLYDPIEYFVNPNKRGYTRTEDVLAAYDRSLPPDSHIWDSDSKGYFPYRMYHQRVLGHRPDVSAHLVFGGFIDDTKATEHADKLLKNLESGEPVFISSITYPERAVLTQLYMKLDPATPLKTLRGMTPMELADSFPGWRIETFPLDGLDDAHIYRFVQR